MNTDTINFRECVYTNAHGHRFFRDHDGRISVCDWSGDFPEETDDGPLIIEPGVRCTVECNENNNVLVRVPVRVERKEVHTGINHCSLILEDFRVLRRLLRVKVEYSLAFQRLRDDILSV
jgi:hypothetical protein